MVKKDLITVSLALAAGLLGTITACSSSTNSAQNSPAASESSAPADSSQKSANSSGGGTAQQENRVRQRAAIRQQLTTILTPEQSKLLDTKLQAGERMRKALTELQLTAEQNTKVQEILKATYGNRQGKDAAEKTKS
jgi:hypothetical protein